MSATTCANCGATLAGAFCASCGQSAHDNHDPTIGHLVHELTHELAHVDGKILGTVRSLVTSPGQLTAEYWAGRRTAWIRPFRVFLIAAAIQFLAVPGIGPMNFNVYVRTADGVRDVFIGAKPPAVANAGTVAASDEETHEYLEKIRHAYAPIRYAAVPVFALAAWAIYRRRQPFYANHVVLAAHFYAAWYTLSVLLSLLPWHGRAIGMVGVAGSAAYLFATVRRLFKQSMAATLASTLGLYVVMMLLELGLALAAGMWVGRSAQ